MQTKIFTTLILASSGALADINMKDAAFLKTMNEFSHPLLEKTYSSRSLWQGAFGFGWCAAFERRLQIVQSQKGILKKCDRQTAVTLLKKQNLWIYQASQGSETYDQEGRLVSISNPRTEFYYDRRGRLASMQTDEEKFSFFYTEDGRKIRKIQSSKSGTVYYTNQEEDLTAVKQGPQTIRLHYDGFHNLIRIESPTEQESISYRTDTDEVASYQTSQSPCTDSFKFEKASAYELRSTVETHCPSSASQKKTYSFIARRNPSGRLTLSEVKTVGGLNDKTNLP